MTDAQIRNWRRILQLEQYRATAGDSNGVVWDDPVARPGYVRVQYLVSTGQSLPPVVRVGMNFTGLLTPGAAIILGYELGELVIQGTDVKGQIAQGINPTFNNPADTSTNTANTPPELTQFSSNPQSPASTSIAIRSLFYAKNGTCYLYNGGAQSLSGKIPAAGNHNLTAYFLTPSNTIEVVSSTDQSMTEPLDLTDIQELFAASTPGGIAGQAWHLHDAQSTITQADKWMDLRPWLNVLADLGEEAVAFSQTATVTIANTGTETTLTGSGVGSLTIPANFLTAGMEIRLHLSGYFSDTLTPTLRFKIKLGGTTILDTTAIALAGTISNNFWEVVARITVRTAGSSGTCIGQGRFTYDESLHSGTTEGLVNTATTTIDTTSALAVDVTAQWGTASASNTISCTNLSVEVID